MPDRKQLPYLLRLLDDDARDVRQAVISELAGFGTALRNEVERLPDGLSGEVWPRVEGLLAEHSRGILREAWPSLLKLDNDMEMLESACGLLSRYLSAPLSAPNSGKPLGPRLDDLAREFVADAEQVDVFTLAAFLFQEKALRGVSSARYHEPRNNDLVYVIDGKLGLPISLSVIYMLIGYRLGIDIEGCNFPGHFLARIRSEGRTLLVDCFHGGRFFEQRELLRHHSGPTKMLRRLIYAETDALIIVARLLRNLISSYERVEDAPNRRLMADLLAMLETV